ncbi:MAG TPA: hypothetical protein VEI52_03810 [Terriglobales bacterium]|nr:hypothetical protein [Terriglobales bacterium]
MAEAGYQVELWAVQRCRCDVDDDCTCGVDELVKAGKAGERLVDNIGSIKGFEDMTQFYIHALDGWEYEWRLASKAAAAA